MKTLVMHNADGEITALGFDAITGNVYVGTQDGYLLACDAEPAREFRCVKIRRVVGHVFGIALDPEEG